MFHVFLQVHIHAACQKIVLHSLAGVLVSIQKVGLKSGNLSVVQNLVLRMFAGRLLRAGVVDLVCFVKLLPSYLDPLRTLRTCQFPLKLKGSEVHQGMQQHVAKTCMPTWYVTVTET